MPLEQGSSREAICHNIATEINAGKDPKQAAAIAYSEAGESRHDSVMSANCAGILFRAPGPQYLLVKRSDTGEWEQPGGHIEADESPEEAAGRECVEEIGSCPDGDRWAIRITKNPDGGDYTCFQQEVDGTFEPKLNDEHTEWQWVFPDALPENTHPEVARTIALVTGNELDIAKRIAYRDLLSPQRYESIWLFDLRITGTGTSYRTALDEYSYRTPEEFLTEEFRERCYGLPVIFEHPKKGGLDTDEFRDRSIGSVFVPYLTTDEVRGVVKILDADAAQLMLTTHASTSPAVVFRDAGSAVSVDVDGKTVLIEGKPSYLDHLAICKEGVWDKGGEPSGVNTGETQMDGIEEQVPAWADALGKRFDEACTTLGARLDALENKGGDQMPTAELTADSAASELGVAEVEGRKEHALEAAALAAGEHEETAEAKAAREAKERKDAEMLMDSARLDSEEKAEKERLEKERKDAARADSQARENAALKAQIKAMDARLTSLATPLSPSDRDALSAAQSRWDSVAQMFGETVSAPLHGESPIAYRKRLAEKFKKHSQSFKAIRFDSIDDESFTGIEAQILNDAQAYARSPAVSPAGRLIPIVRHDSAGRQITEWSGDMDVWLNHFKHHGMVAKVLRPSNGAR
ncbi:ADP-ribose pyrophosphatase YjhB, NUDIX family [Paraburkholderia phenazinium]|uniref:ADP-ribose pyrophosphatase YjhB, NUDIX family n=1 Tax=Paraburkholderia phenazinium TaxID=60549 RepID=A0A1G7ZM41_9BURK|nr:NUDIX hydrolase [Paraburkholderia phenazinium]SDH09729.1 ADP-ribose pyrophosphatase YjhB, NUDIX family [Paraburkholderia phenazinium]